MNYALRPTRYKLRATSYELRATSYELRAMNLKIGEVILVQTKKPAIERFQRQAGYGENSVWTHVCGSLGGLICIEGNFPRSRLIDFKKTYLEPGFNFKRLRRKGQTEKERYKVALWWATMNNLPYDAWQFFSMPLSYAFRNLGEALRRVFGSQMRFLCSQLIAEGFYQEGDYLFNKPAHLVVPADFCNPDLFEEVK